MSGPWSLTTTVSIIEESLATCQATLRAEAERHESMDVDDVADRLEVIAAWLHEIHDRTRVDRGRGLETVACGPDALGAYDENTLRLVRASS